jgi:uncharacterized protein (TIGR03066 family)
MRMIMGFMAMMLVVAAAPADDKTEKIDAKKLVGKWEPKEGNDKGKVVVEFTKDGKFSVTQDKKVDGGTYTVDGNKVTIMVKIMDKEIKHSFTVTKLTDTEMMTKDEGLDKEETMIRMKDK